MHNTLSMIGYQLRQTFRRLVADPSTGVCKMETLAVELGYDASYVNNRLYGKVAVDDAFLRDCVDWLRQHYPKYCSMFLQEYFNCRDIYVGDSERVAAVTIDDLHDLIAKLNYAAAEANLEHVNHMADGQMDLFECERELNLIRLASERLNIYRASILEIQASLYRESVSSQHATQGEAR